MVATKKNTTEFKWKRKQPKRITHTHSIPFHTTPPNHTTHSVAYTLVDLLHVAHTFTINFHTIRERGESLHCKLASFPVANVIGTEPKLKSEQNAIITVHAMTFDTNVKKQKRLPLDIYSPPNLTYINWDYLCSLWMWFRFIECLNRTLKRDLFIEFWLETEIRNSDVSKMLV